MRWLFAAIVSPLAIAQTLTQAETAELARAAKNPFDLAKFIDNHPAPGWRIDVKIATHQLVVAPDYTQRDFEACKTKLLTVKRPEQVIVVIECEWFKGFVRYTRQSSGSWQAEGAADAGYRAPQEYQLDDASGTPFFRYSFEGMHGSDVSGYFEDWIDLTRPGFKAAFGIMPEGWEDRRLEGIGRKISTNVVERNNEIRATLHIQFFTNHHDTLATLATTLVYSRTDPAGPFRCHSLDPGVSCKDVDTLTYLSEGDSPTEEYLIRFALPGLKKIAAGPDSETKQWLREYLAKRKNTPEVRELRALLK